MFNDGCQYDWSIDIRILINFFLLLLILAAKTVQFLNLRNADMFFLYNLRNKLINVEKLYKSTT